MKNIYIFTKSVKETEIGREAKGKIYIIPSNFVMKTFECNFHQTFCIKLDTVREGGVWYL